MFGLRRRTLVVAKKGTTHISIGERFATQNTPHQYHTACERYMSQWTEIIVGGDTDDVTCKRCNRNLELQG